MIFIITNAVAHHKKYPKYKLFLNNFWPNAWWTQYPESYLPFYSLMANYMTLNHKGLNEKGTVLDATFPGVFFVIFAYILLKFLSQGPIDSDSALAITIMIWCLVDTKPLPESVPMDINNDM